MRKRNRRSKKSKTNLATSVGQDENGEVVDGGNDEGKATFMT